MFCPNIGAFNDCSKMIAFNLLEGFIKIHQFPTVYSNSRNLTTSCSPDSGKFAFLKVKQSPILALFLGG